MKQQLRPGGMIDMITPDEMASIIPRPRQVSHIRVPATVTLNGAGVGQDEVYKVPTGYEFEVRRITLTLTGNAPNSPSTNNVPLVAGAFVAYLRAGSLIEYGQPTYGATVQIPGTQTWGDEQGPYLQNAEVFEVYAAGLTPSVQLSVYLEGLLIRPDTKHAA